MASAKVPSPVNPAAIDPSARLARGTMDSPSAFSHRLVRSCRQYQHVPHASTKDAMTRSPFFTAVTSEPTSSMMPVPSWPRMHGGGTGTPPFWAVRSEWHTPLALTLTSTSRGPGGDSSTSSMERG
jgi:hypothetical protein